MKRYLIGIALFFGITESIFGQVLFPIQTDRPDQTECPFIVPKNHIQIESGFNFEKVNENEKNYLYPTILWKYGVNEKFEIRLISELTTNKISEKNVTGINPIKPLSTLNLRTTYFAPSFRFTMQHTLTRKISLGYNLGVEWDGENAEPTFIYTLTSGISLSEKTGAYLELYGFAPQKDAAEHRFNGGLTYFLKPNIMFDISGGFGLTENAPKYYSSLGLSIRLPN